MQRRLAALCLLVVLLVSSTALAVDFKTKPKLAFYPLVAKSVEAISFTEAISTQLFNNIERTDFFEILERKKVESVLTQDAAKLTTLSKEALYNVANRAGFDIFIVGNVSRVESASLIELQVVGSSSRSSYYTETFRVPEFETPKRLQEIAEKIVVKVKGFNLAPPPVESKISCPANLTISGTPRSIKLKWAPPESTQIIGYAIMRSKSPNSSFVQIATTTKPSYTDDNLKLNETFYYKVKAISKSGIECETTESLVGRTSPAPLPPIFMEIKSDLAGAQLSWYSRPYSGGDRNLVTSGFQIYRKGPDEPELRVIAKVSAAAVSYTDNDIKNGVVYSYALTAYNPDMVESEFSSVLEGRSAQAANNIKAVGGSRKVQLSWIPNESKSVEGYSIYRSNEADQGYKKVGQVKGRSGNSYLDAGLEDGVTYWYSIAAQLGDQGETPKSDPVSAATRQRPASPAGLSASNNEPRRVTLSWNKVGAPGDDISGCYLYRATEKEGNYVKIAEIPNKKTSYIDDKMAVGKTEKGGLAKLGSLMGDGSRPLADGATYHYRLSCFNEAGSESLPSEPVSATTRAGLAAPKGLKASNGQPGKITLTWDASQEFKEYELYRGPVGQNEVQRIKTVKEPFYLDTAVVDGASYIYAVKGIDALKIESAISTSVTGSAKAKPAVPKKVTVTEQDGKKVVLWEANPEKDVLRYVIYKKNFVGIFQKLQTVYGTYYDLLGLKGKVELRIAAQDQDGLESDKTDVIAIDLK